MKNMKKASALLLALVMVLALAAPVLAAPATETGMITIDNGVGGQTYQVYRIFDLSYGGTADNDENAPHTYTVADKWQAFFAEGAPGLDYVEIDSTGAVTWIEGKDPAKFAEAALAFATAEETAIASDGTDTTGGDAYDEQNYVVEFKGLPLGYYLIDSSLGALCTLDSVNRNVTVHEKNERPTLEKDIPDPSGLKVGDSVAYKVTVEAKRGAIDYVVTDTMTNLEFNNDIVVTIGEGENATVVDEENYTVVSRTDGFTLTFDNDYLRQLTAGLKETESVRLVVSYTGTITPEALSAPDPVTNKAQLNYGDNGTPTSTPEKEVPTYLYDFDLTKTNSANELLAGAVFQLKDANDKVISLVLENGAYRPAILSGDNKDTEGVVTEITTNQNDVISFKGFGKGTYVLEEIAPPTGYNKLKTPVTFEIRPIKDAQDKDTNQANIVTVNDKGEEVISSLKATVVPGTPASGEGEDATPATPATATGGVQVVNFTGAELPSTGGIGTTMFYVIGGVLIVGAAILLITKKRMSGEEQ